MQTLPFAVVTNPHMSHVYDLYYKAFEKFRRVREIQTIEDNERYCQLIAETLQDHLTVIPRLAMGVLECQNLMRAEQIDKLMNTLLRSVRFKTLRIRLCATADLMSANFSEGNCRTTSCADRDIQFSVALSTCNVSWGLQR